MFAVPGKPAEVKGIIISSTSIMVSWLPPLEPNGQLIHYILIGNSIPKNSEGRIQMTQKTVSPDKLQFEVNRVFFAIYLC